jgi:putative addiction module component (TIGR02574 family)
MNQTLRKLPVDQRLELMEELWDSLVADQKEMLISEEHKTILDQRLAAFEQDGDMGRPAKSVLMEMKNRL